MYEVMEMKGTSHRVLFQNAEGKLPINMGVMFDDVIYKYVLYINMGVMFDDPNVEISDLLWYNVLAQQLNNGWIYQEENEKTVSYDKKRDILSCYVELHRNGSLKNICKL